MNELNHETVLRQYLLGYLEDEVSLGRIETRLMTDDQFADEVGLAESQLIENYLDGDLSDHDLTRFDRHFLASPQRRSELRLTRDLRKFSAAAEKTIPHEAKRSPAGWFLLPSFQWLRFAALAAVVIAAGLGIWRFAIYESDTEKGLAQLQLAYRGQRPSESRTSADFDYAPLSDLRGDGQPPVDERARARAERYLFDATENTVDADAHHALGLYYLAGKDFDKALAEFTQALKSAPNNAAIHGDIGATYFEKAKRADFEGNPGEVMQNLALALESTNRALEIAPTLRPPLFDRALILQKMPLPQQAREAWGKYLEIDAASPWADEARRNLEALNNQTSQPVDKSSVLKDFLEARAAGDHARAWKIASQTKELVTGVMLSTQLARAVSAEPTSAKTEAVQALLYLGELEMRNSGDRFFGELAGFYTSANSSRRQTLFQAHEKLREAHELILKADFTRALAASQQAAQTFSSAGSSWEAKIADHRAAYCLTQLNRIEESNDLLKKLSEFCGSRSYLWLEGLSEGVIASNFSLLGEHTRAIGHNERSLRIANSISDTCNLLKVHNQMTAEHWRMGDASRTFDAVRLTLNYPDIYFLSPRQKARNILFGTDAFFRFGHSAAAAAFSREGIHVAREEVKDKWLTHTVQTQLAAILGAAGQYPVAFEAIERGLETANSLDDAVMRQRLKTRSLLTAASLQRRSGNCEKAAQSYDQVISDYKEANFSLNKYEAHKGRLLCLIEQKQNDVVTREIPEILKIFDENRQAISAEADRNTFFDNEQDVYDVATDYAYSQLGQPDLAFEYAENSRARSLLNSINNQPGVIAKPLSLAETRERIPSRVQMLYYAVVANQVLAWKISGTGVVSAAQPIRKDELEAKVRGYTEMLTARKDIRAAAEALYKLLISPLSLELQADQTLCIIADKSLLRVPFASLISPETGKYLIEEHALLYSPSASVFIDETEIARQRGLVPEESVLSIGNPTFSRTEYPNLPDLPAAAREATEIKALYPSANLLTGGGASKERIIDKMNKSSVVHFASHYVPNMKFPTRSKFLLLPDDLMLEEIPPDAVKDVRLVVLSACDTGVERFYKGEGIIGAARAFLSRGVPLVVASQWSVDSEATAELMIDFHRLRTKGKLSATTALQRSQVEMLKSEDTRFRAPFYWASFIPIGGYTNY